MNLIYIECRKWQGILRILLVLEFWENVEGKGVEREGRREKYIIQ